MKTKNFAHAPGQRTRPFAEITAAAQPPNIIPYKDRLPDNPAPTRQKRE